MSDRVRFAFRFATHDRGHLIAKLRRVAERRLSEPATGGRFLSPPAGAAFACAAAGDGDGGGPGDAAGPDP